MLGFFKLILLAIIGIIIAGSVCLSNIFNNDIISKDDLVNSYSNFL